MAWSNLIDRFRSLQVRRAESRADDTPKDVPEGASTIDDHHPVEDIGPAAESHPAVTTGTEDASPDTRLDAAEHERTLPLQPAVVLDAALYQGSPMAVAAPASPLAPQKMSPEEQLAAQWAARRAAPLRPPQAWQPAPIVEPPVEFAVSVPAAVHSLEPEAPSHNSAATEEAAMLGVPSEDESPIPEIPTASNVVSGQDVTITPPSVPSLSPEPEILDGPSETTGDSIDPLQFQTLHTIEPLLEDDAPFMAPPSAEVAALPEAAPIAINSSHDAADTVDEPSPAEAQVAALPEAAPIALDSSHDAAGTVAEPSPAEAGDATLPEGTSNAPPPPSPTALSLPTTPWTPRAAGDSSELAPSPRFAMLHALARRWHHPLPTRRFLLSIGSRSEARKLAPVIRSLRSRAAIEGRPEEVLVCATGEDPQSVRQVLESLRIVVDCDLDIMSAGENAAAASARMLSSFESLLAQVKPQWLIVEGATTASAMASVAAYYAGIRVARVEGGPAPFNVDDLYPSEIIRQVVGLFSSVHFAETDWSREHLVQEGIPDEEIFVIGNTGVDAVHETCAELGLQLGPSAVRSSGVVKVLIVVERRSISESEVVELCQVVRNLVGSVPGLYEFVWPLPASTTLARKIRELLGRVQGVVLTPPADYADILRGIHACDIVLTDSPDLQEEAPSLGKPVLVMRESVDRPEAVRAGVAMLVGTARGGIQAAVRTLARKLSSRHGLITNPYGDGRAAARIADFFEGRHVLEFGRTAQPRMLPPAGPPEAPLQLEASAES